MEETTLELMWRFWFASFEPFDSLDGRADWLIR